MKKKATKTEKVATALRNRAMTSKEISSRFDVPNVRAMLYDLKRKGLKVLRIATFNTKGDKVIRYSTYPAVGKIV